MQWFLSVYWSFTPSRVFFDEPNVLTLMKSKWLFLLFFSFVLWEMMLTLVSGSRSLHFILRILTLAFTLRSLKHFELPFHVQSKAHSVFWCSGMFHY